MDNVHANGGFNAQLEQQKGFTDATLRRDLFDGFNSVSGYGSSDSASKFLPEIEITNDTADTAGTANNTTESEGDGKAKPTEPSDNGNVPGHSSEPSTKTLRTCTADDPHGTKE